MNSIIKKTVSITGIVCLGFLIIGSTIPYLLPKQLSEENRAVSLQLGGPSSEQGPDRIVLVEEPADSLNARLALVQEAQESLDIVYYAINEDDCGEALLGEVLLAADRGVQVRVLVDGTTGYLSGNTHPALKAMNTHPNISCRVYAPPRLYAPWELHAMLHDKFIIADGEYMLLGGRNIDQRHFAPEGYTKPVTNDRDVLIKKTSDKSETESAIDQTARYMESLWNYELTREVKSLSEKKTAKKLEHLYTCPDSFRAENEKFYIKTLSDYEENMSPTSRITLLSNPINAGKKEPTLAWQLKQLVEGAEKSVTVQTPYATGNKKILEALTNAAEDAELVIQTNSLVSSPNFPAFSNYYFQRSKFLATGAEIYEYQHSDSIHGKSILIDDYVSVVGSFNLDDRSMYIDTETMLVIESPEFAESLSEAIGELRADSLKVGEDNRYEEAPEKSPSVFKRIIMALVYIILKPFQSLI